MREAPLSVGNGSLFDRLGGQPTIDAAVSRLCERTLADKDLAPFFERADLERVR